MEIGCLQSPFFIFPRAKLVVSVNSFLYVVIVCIYNVNFMKTKYYIQR